MDEKLIAGYAAYTDAEEYGTATLGEAPGTVIVTISIATGSAASGASVAATFDIGC